MIQPEERTAAVWLAAVLHELVAPTATAQLSVEHAAHQLESAVRVLRRAARCTEALRWLVRMLLQDETAAAERAICSITSALSLLVPPGVALCTEFPEHLSVLSAPGTLELVLGNLLANAHKHASGAALMVRAKSTEASRVLWPTEAQVQLQGRVVLLTVIDDGPGIEVNQRLFEPFEADGTGNGVGLWLCRLVVRAHGGDLWLDRTTRGASFTSAWPSASPLQQGVWPGEPDELGRALRQAREAAHLTRAELAHRAGVADSTIRNIERGRHKCTPKILIALTNALGSFPSALRFWPR